MKKIEFKDEWDELCPIYFRYVDTFKQVGTGVLINIFDNIYLVTASHVIDYLYSYKDADLLIPTINGFDSIAGIIYHSHLKENENRDDDKIDISFYKLSQEMVNVLDKYSIPLTEDKISFTDDYSVDNTVNMDELKNIIHPKEIPNMMKKLHENEDDLDSEKINELNEIICNTTITFAGFPNTKSKNRGSVYYGEIVYYRGRGLSKEEYVIHNYEKHINILAEFGKSEIMDKNFVSYNPPKPQGISGGGVYKIIETEKGFDRVLIGIGHTYKNKKHLFIGTNIKVCINMIYGILNQEKNNV